MPRPVPRSALAVLFLCAMPSYVDAQQFVCRPIVSGDTASSLARRLTGNAAAAYGLAFQIRDPARRMFVPKSHYQHLQSDWQACVAPGPISSTPAASAPVIELASSQIAPEEPMADAARPALASTALVHPLAEPMLPHRSTVAPLGAAALAVVLLSAVAGSLARRPMPPDFRRTGENFVAVFARPLLDPSSTMPPVETRLRFRRRKRQLEIFIAPGHGHRYPNLADHKKNVEYDVDRVIGILGNCVLSKPPRASGKWVRVTVELRERT